MSQEAISARPEIPILDIEKIRQLRETQIQTIRDLIQKNKVSIASILVMTSSIIIPAYCDWRHPIIGAFLGALSMACITALGIEQLTNAEKEFEDFKLNNSGE